MAIYQNILDLFFYVNVKKRRLLTFGSDLLVYVVIVFVLLSLPVFSQTDLSTPRSTIDNHYSNLQDGNFYPKVAAKSLYKGGLISKKIESLAIKLKKILDGKKIFIKLIKIPDNENYIDSTLGQNIYYLSKFDKSIYLKKYADKWLYSEETVNSIDRMYSSIYFIDISDYVEELPNYFHSHLFGITLWQFIGVLVLALIAFLLSRILKSILKYLFFRGLAKFSKLDIAVKYLAKVASPFSIGFAVLFLDYSLNLLVLPVPWLEKISFSLRLIFPFLFILLGWNLSDFVGEVLSSVHRRNKSKLDSQLVPFGRKLLKGFVILIGLFYFISSLGIDYTPLLAGASIGGLALALAAQETVKNVFGSITIFIDQPFEVGDYIVFEGGDGTVEEIGLRSTRIRTMYDSLITMPNGKLIDMLIDNLGARKNRRYKTFYSFPYNTPPDLINLYIEGLREIVLKHPQTNKDIYYIYINELSAHSIDILVNIFFRVENWEKELIARSEFITEALNLANEIGIHFAIPAQRLKVQSEKEFENEYVNYPEEKSNIIKKFNNYLGKKLDD